MARVWVEDNRSGLLLTPQDAALPRAATGIHQGAQNSYLRSAWETLSVGSADAELLGDLDSLRDRSLELVANEALAASVSSTLVANVVGTGLTPQPAPKAKFIPGQAGKVLDFQDRAEWLWQKFAKKADITGRQTLSGLQRLAVRQVFETGEALFMVRRKNRSGTTFRLSLKAVDPARLSAGYKSSHQGREIRKGVEIDRDEQPVAYWIQNQRGSGLPQHVRIPARDSKGRPNVFHIYEPERPGQSRGKPGLTPVLNLFHDLSKYREAEVIAARVSACIAAFITRPDPMEGMGQSTVAGVNTPAAGDRLKTLAPGMIEHLGLGEKVEPFLPGRPNANANDFIMGMMRQIGAALGLPYELVVKDFSQTNYSSARAALLEARLFFNIWQQLLSEKFLQPLWELLLDEAVGNGLLAAPGFDRLHDEWCACRWVSPGWKWVDPLKEVWAAEKAVDSELSTLADENAALGRSWEEVVDQRHRERMRILEHRAKEQKFSDKNNLSEDDENVQD